jgi:hypothetical protein
MPQLDKAGTKLIPASVLGRIAFYYDPVLLESVPVEGSGGAINVNAVVVPAPPGTIIGPSTNTAVPGLGTVALPLPPVGALSIIVQNIGPSGSLVRVRAATDAVNTGIILQRFAAIAFNKAVAPLVVQNNLAAASTVAQTFEVT